MGWNDDPLATEEPASAGFGKDPQVEIDDTSREAVQSVIGKYGPEERLKLGVALQAKPGDFDAWVQQQSFGGKLAQELAARRDSEQSAEALKYQAENAYDPTALAEARRHWILHPEVDLDHVVQNLAQYRKDDAAAGVGEEAWATLKQYHPALADIIGDPAKAGLVLQDVETLSTLDRWFGGVVPLYGKPNPDGSRPMGVRGVNPFWATLAYDVATHDVPAHAAKAAAALTDAQMWVGHFLGPVNENATARRWELAGRLASETTDAKSYIGADTPGGWYEPHRLVHGLEVGTEFVVKNLPLLLGAALTGGSAAAASGAAEGSTAALAAAHRGIWAFNTFWAAPDEYQKGKEASGSSGMALGRMVVGAPIIGKVMGWNPISSVAGQQAWRVLDSAVARAAMEASSLPNYLRVGGAIATKAGLDFYTGKAAFAAQSASGAALDELSRSLGTDNKASAGRVYEAAIRGWHDGDAAALMSIYGTGQHLISDIGRVVQGHDMSQRVSGALDEVSRLKLTKLDPMLAEQVVKALATQAGRDTTLHLPLSEVQDTLDKAGLNVRDTIGNIHGDGGAAYDKAVQEGAANIEIPVEKLHRVLEVPQLEDLARKHGTFDPRVWSFARTLKESQAFKDSFDAAIKVDPETLPPEEKGVYDALLAFAGTDADVAKRLYGYVKAYQGRHPELTAQQAYSDTFGPGGAYGPPGEPAPTAEPTPKSSDVRVQNVGHGKYLQYEHPNAPLQLRINDTMPGELDPVRTVAHINFDKNVGDSQANREKYGGRGFGMSLYFRALADAQKAGVGFASDVERKPVAEKTYDRLKALGVPFEQSAEGRYVIKAEDLAKVDLGKVEAAWSDAHGPPSEASQVLQAGLTESGLYNAEEWGAATKDEAVKADLQAKQAEAAQAASDRLDTALKSGVKQIVYERSQLTGQAEKEIRSRDEKGIYKYPGQRTRHFFTDGELWGASDRDDPRVVLMTDPETGRPWRLLRSEVQALGFDPAQFPDGTMTNDPRKSMDVDMAANALGYPGSGYTGGPARKMLSDLRDALPEGAFHKQWADMKLRQAYGNELLDNPRVLLARVMDSVQNEKVVPMLLARLRALSASLDPARRARSAMDPEMWAKYAEQIINDKTIGGLKPDRFADAAKTASQSALKALEEGKHDKAFDHTEAALLNHYLYRAARETVGSVGAIESKLTQRAGSDANQRMLGLANPALRDFHNAVLGALGFKEALPGAKETLPKLLAALDPQDEAVAPTGMAERIAMDKPGGWTKDLLQSVLGGERAWKDLKPAEAVEVNRALQNIQHIAKVMTAEKSAESDATRDRLLDAAQSYLSLAGARKGKLYAQRSLDPRQRDGLLGSVKRMLVGIWKDEPNLPARVLLALHGPEVAEHFDGRWLAARLKEQEILSTIYPEWKDTQSAFANDPDFHKPLPGLTDELGLKDANGYGKDGALTKAHLVQILKWYGSETGRNKILNALDISAPDLEKLFGRYLSHDTVLAVQAEHTVLDKKVFPLMSESWQGRTGVPLEKTVAMPYRISYADGTAHSYEGGYFPIHWTDIPRRIDMEVQSSVRPKVPDGAFQTRTKFVGNPDLDWSNMPGHLLADIHNIAFGDFVQEGNRILLHPRMKDLSERFLGPEYRNWSDAWLRRIAGEGVPRAAKDLNWLTTAARGSRSMLVTGAVGFNLPIFAAHMTHPLATALLRDGFSMSVSYAAPSMQRVMEGAVAHLTTGHDPIREFAMSRSQVLPLRESTMVDDMNRWRSGDYAARLGGMEGGEAAFRQRVQEASFAHLREMDKLVSTMIWDAKYRYEMDTHGDEPKAIKEADDQVRAAMPNYNPMEQPSILADKGNPLSAMLVFQTYWSKYGELVRESRINNVDRPFAEAFAGQRSKADAATHAASFAARYAAALTVGIVGGEFLKGQGKQENEDWTTWFLRKEATAPLKMFPYASEILGPYVEQAIQQKRHMQKPTLLNPFFAPVERALGAVSKVMDQRASTADKVEAVATAALMLKGYPATAVTRAARYGYDVATGEARPRGVPDAISGTVFGQKTGRASRYQEKTPLNIAQDFTKDRPTP